MSYVLKEIEERIPNESLIELVKKQEVQFLSILLKNKDCLKDAYSSSVLEEHFWSKECQKLYAIMIETYRKFNSILTKTQMDSIMEMSMFKKMSEEQKIACKSLWHSIYHEDVSTEDYQFLKTSIKERDMQWKAFKVFQKYTDEIVSSLKDQKDLVKNVQFDINNINTADDESYALTLPFEDGLEESMKYITHRRDNPDAVDCVYMGLKQLDKHMCGLERGSYTVITGYINGCKTTLMFNIAFNMAKAGYNVVYVTLEKKAVPLVVRLHSLHAAVDYNRIKRGGKKDYGLCDSVYNELIEAYNDLKVNIKPKLDIIQLPQKVKLTRVLSDVDKIRNKKPIDVIVVDYLQAMGFESNTPGRPDLDLADVSKRLQAYGREKNLVTITAIQLKNQSAKELRGKVKKIADTDIATKVDVNTEDLSGSQQVGADADNVIAVVKDDRDSPPTKVFVTVVKSRDSEQNKKFIFDFNGAIGSITDPELEPGQIKAVDEIVYNSNITEAELDTNDDLYGKEDAPSKASDWLDVAITKKENKEVKNSSSSSSEDIPEQKPRKKKKVEDIDAELGLVVSDNIEPKKKNDDIDFDNPTEDKDNIEDIEDDLL